MIYEIHLYVPKTGNLAPSMIDWMYDHGQESDVPESHWPVRKVKPRAVARLLMRLDNTLVPMKGAGEDVELHYPNSELGIVLYAHDRGVIIFFPYMSYSVYSRVVLGICYTYIRFLYDAAGFWSFDPQLDVISFADDYTSLEETAILMDKIMPRLLEG